MPAADGEWERFAAALDDDFNTPEALAVMHGWRDHELLRRALDVFGLESLADVSEDAPAEVVDLAERRRPPAPAATSPRPTGCARRWRRPAGRCATSPRSPATGSSGGGDARARLRPHAVRESLRGPREVLEIWATERALRAEPWLREAEGLRVHVKPERELTRGGRHARPPGRGRAGRAVPVRRRVRARRARAAAARLPRPGHRPAQPRRGRSAAPRAPARRASSCPRTAPRA